MDSLNKRCKKLESENENLKLDRESIKHSNSQGSAKY